MSGIKDWLAGAANEATGLAKRAAGELTARPDLVLDGERQQARGRKEVAAAGDEKEEGGHRTTVGWKLDPAERTGLLALFPPHYAITVADHVTLAANAPAEMPLPPFRVGRIVGAADDGQGVQALVVSVDGSPARADGGTFHITWSLAPGRRASESNDVLARFGWAPVTMDSSVSLRPARL